MNLNDETLSQQRILPLGGPRVGGQINDLVDEKAGFGPNTGLLPSHLRLYCQTVEGAGG